MPSAVLRIVSDEMVSSDASVGVPCSSYVRVLTPESTDSRLTR
jgi:hypothetical protein